MKTFIVGVFVLSLFAFATAEESLGQTPPRPAGCPRGGIYPFACVMPVPRPGEQRGSQETTIGFAFEGPPLIAYFGYVNSCSEPVVLPVGDDNFFSPDPQDRGQPTVFEPGIHYKAFATTFIVSPSIPQLTWFLEQNLVTARNHGLMYCQNPASLMWKGPWSATKEYFENDVVTFEGSAWIATRPKFTPLPLISTVRNINVTPAEGEFWTSLAQSQPGPPGPQGPPGPIGPGLNVDQFRTVTNETVLGSAFAQCADNELILTGGGSCGSGPTDALQHSAPSGLNAWRVRCQHRLSRATAFAICFPRPAPTPQPLDTQLTAPRVHSSKP